MTMIYWEGMKIARLWDGCNDMRRCAVALSYSIKMDLRMLYTINPLRSSVDPLHGSSCDINVTDFKFMT
jgi:hypothetical protein